MSNHVSQGFAAKLAQHDVTVAEWVVLRALFDSAHPQPSELAAALGLSRGAISKLIARLAAKRLVSIQLDRRDGRAQRLRLRAAGQRLVPRLAALADQNDAEAFGHLTAKQRAELRATLQAIIDALALDGVPMD